MTKKRFWTVVFMVGNVPRVVRRYKSLKNAYAAINEYEASNEEGDNVNRAWLVKTDNRNSHKKKVAGALDINDASTLPTVYVRVNGPLGHLAVSEQNPEPVQQVYLQNNEG